MSPPVAVYDDITGSVYDFESGYFVSVTVPDDTFDSWIVTEDGTRQLYVIASILDYAHNPFGGRALIEFRNSASDSWHFIMDIDSNINGFSNGRFVSVLPSYDVTSVDLEFGIFGGGGIYNWDFSGLSLALAMAPAAPEDPPSEPAVTAAVSMLHMSTSLFAFVSPAAQRMGRSSAQVVG